MTYCLGMLVDDGLVMLADTRTNAGVDNISTYRKLRIAANPPDRLVAIASAGSLSTTQAAMQRLDAGVLNPETNELDTFLTVPSIFAAAQAAGRAVRMSRDALSGLQQENVNFDATLLIGGAVGDEPLRLFLVYSAGNVIECGPDTPYLQIGEVKYGKPILDRALRHSCPLPEAIKIALISFDSTMRSNLAVGPPLDLLIVRNAKRGHEEVRRITDDDEYFRDLSQRWSEALSHARAEIPDPPY